MTRTRLLVALLLISLSAVVSATGWIGHAVAPACDRSYVFARDINGAPGNTFYYRAHDCETVFVATGAAVVLPPLVGQTAPQTVTVLNIGTTEALVGAGDAVLDPQVTGYTTSFPQLPVWSSATAAMLLQPGERRTFRAMPNKLGATWFSQ